MQMNIMLSKKGGEKMNQEKMCVRCRCKTTATSPIEVVKALPSLKELSDNTMEWSNEQLRIYEDKLSKYKANVYRIMRLREDMEKEEREE